MLVVLPCFSIKKYTRGLYFAGKIQSTGPSLTNKQVLATK